MFDFGIKDRLTKMLNPNATQADTGLEMQAYYDEKLKVWVFPGEDPAEKAKPVGPPPTAKAKSEQKQAPSSAPVNAQPKDPLAAMMAPPMRTPRAGGSARPRGLPGGTPMGATPMPPPNFAVFAPKPAAEKKAEGKDEKKGAKEDDEKNGN